MTDKTALAWAAGFFEGEGCISWYSKVPNLQLCIVNTDLECLEKFRSIVGGGNIRERTHAVREGYKAQYQLVIAGDDAHVIYRRLRPWLSSRRQARYADYLRARADYEAAATAERICPHCGTTFRPEWSKVASYVRWCSSKCCDRAKYLRRRARLVDESTRAA